jgi:2-polyprenyl-3-methyl-5-hydroxy-6-metoxy-1,4-benzoquinol methylase
MPVRRNQSPQYSRPLLGRALTSIGRLRLRAGAGTPPRDEIIARHAPGRSFVDVGCMWNIHGALCFAAEDAGAASVTGVDVMAPTERFLSEVQRRDSQVRFIEGDLHDGPTVAAIGPHEVVWCSGVIYHAPHPLLTLQRLRELTTGTLLLATETIPETPGRRGTCIIAPGPGDHPNARPPTGPNEGYGPWYWGISSSALRTMLTLSGFEVVEEFGLPFHMTVVAR